MNRRFISFAYFSCIAAFSTVIREVTSVVIHVAQLIVEAVATPAANIWARLSLPKVIGFQVVGLLKRIYQESLVTSGQSLHKRRSVYC
ncbi:hypothetical protein QE369_002988 [Agrobacterium larrymoorei]|uniref:Uncharacterized protein n=1 Tax=Agrobacterium larrymoorei TaxID=160699 RepID=A0AAJ2ES68_9HYPH|nr:hypothetical protein [Agrobacterium larrymoorei]MDR6102791.1 hypothetical protein [Agrobacterium larrymoorei]